MLVREVGPDGEGKKTYWSVGSLTLTTEPWAPKASPTMFSSASKDRFPMKRVSEAGLVESPYCLARSLARSLGAALSRGVAKSTLAMRPSISVPFLALRAAVASTDLANSTYPKPLERPESLSVRTRAPVISPNSSNSRYSHSSSMFQLRLPTKRFLTPLSSSSTLAFLAEATGSSSALRFLEGSGASSSSSLELSEPLPDSLSSSESSSASSSSLEAEESESSESFCS
jgi:hypothetical protein